MTKTERMIVINGLTARITRLEAIAEGTSPAKGELPVLESPDAIALVQRACAVELVDLRRKRAELGG